MSGAYGAPGRSFLAGLIGAGIGPSLTPPMHEREAARLGRSLVYRTIDIDRLGMEPGSVGYLVEAASRLGFDGLNITHPCKRLVLPALDGLSPEAEALGAVNTVVFGAGGAVGHNTDWSGFARSLRQELPDAPGDRVVVLGAGGAGAAVAYALLVSGVRELAVVDVDGTSAEALAARLAERFPGAVCRPAGTDGLGAALAGADGLVHATPTGMAHHPGIPLDPGLLRPSLWVADVVYRPVRTELLRAAQARGCRTLSGGGMAVFQASDAFGLITGLEPSPEHLHAHFRELVARE
ncbi:shikimate dehydrogenase [Nocardiopsis sp. ARC36]